MQVQWQRWALGCEGDLSAAPQRCFPRQMVWDIRRLRPERFYQCERATSLHPLQYKYLEKTISLIGEKWDPLVNFLPLLLTIGDCIFPSNGWATCLFCLESPLRLCHYRGSRRGLVKTAHSIHEECFRQPGLSLPALCLSFRSHLGLFAALCYIQTF